MGWATLTGSKATAGSLANWLNNGTLTSGAGGVADIVLQEACDWIYRRLRHWRMMTAPLVGTLVVGQDFITCPGDMLEPDDFFLTGNYYQRLEQKTSAEVISAWSFDGNGNRVQQQPVIYYFDQASFRFDSVADQAYAYALTYYQQPAPLSAANDTNFLTQNCARLLRLACMTAACEWSKDSGQGNVDRTYWEQLAMAEIDVVQTESDRAKRAAVVGAILIGGGSGGQSAYAF